jgi:GAF domain-containing protein
MNLGRLGSLFVDLSRPPGDDASAGTRLCTACVELLDVRDVGILLVDPDGGVDCFATSAPSSIGVLEDLQFTLGEGPGLDAHASGRPVFESDLANPTTAQWSAFAPAAVREGVRGVFSFPLRAGAVRLGALDLSRAAPGGLSRQHWLDGIVMAGVVTRRLLAAQADAPPGLLGHDLDDPRTLRVEVHQAAGMISEQLDVPAADALVLLRAAAYAAERPIDDLAHDVVARRLRFDDHHA